MNEESLTRQLSNPKSGAIVVIVYSGSYGPSVKVLEQLKRVIEAYPSIHLIQINADDHRHLLSAPVLGISDVPSVIMYYKGRRFAGPLTDQYQVTDRIKSLAVVSMEVDDFDCIGTNMRVSNTQEMQKWSITNSLGSSRGNTTSIFHPIHTVMDSLYDIYFYHMGLTRSSAFRIGVLCASLQHPLGDPLIPVVTSRNTSPTSSIAFVSFGDWGMPEGVEVLSRTRDRIRSLPQVDFIALLGDNYYGSHSSDMLQLFDTCRVSPNLVHYAVLGNHDYRGHQLFQLGLSKTDPSWHLPSPYYAKLFRSGDVTICSIFIDTELIHTKSGNDQISWMEQVLMSESCQAANWRIVSGHRNVFTGGIYSKEVRVKEAIHSLLTQARVHVYYSGHEHNMQLLHDGKILYGISGKINQGMKPIEYSHEYLKWHAHEVPGFIYTVATPNELRLVMYGTDIGPIKSIRLTRV